MKLRFYLLATVVAAVSPACLLAQSPVTVTMGRQHPIHGVGGPENASANPTDSAHDGDVRQSAPATQRMKAPVINSRAGDHGGTDHSAMDHGAMDHGAMNHSTTTPTTPPAATADHTAMDHAHMNHGSSAGDAASQAQAGHRTTDNGTHGSHIHDNASTASPAAAAAAPVDLPPTPAPAGTPPSTARHARHQQAPAPAPAPAPKHAPAHSHPSAHPGSPLPATYVNGSGTTRLPAMQGGMTGVHAMAGDWMLMGHGYIQLNYTDHKGPRGDDLVYSTSMLMLSGEREFGGARLQLRSMLSLEPTMSARGYPNLFATGETADGIPLVDRQHPHDLFMELAARVDVDIAPGASLFLYGGPVGEPALGPAAFMHRGSAHYNPEPPVTHHWFDSTHITYGVVTAGLSLHHWQIEGSAFRGREPDEERWGIETPALDSWSVRLSWTPTDQWAAQVSHGFLKQPETTHGDQNEYRTTASLHFSDGALSATGAFSSKNRSPGTTSTAWLGEVNYDLTPRHSLYGRVENVSNDELIGDHDDPLHDQPFRITKAQAGYAWNTPIGKGPINLALGGSVNLYGKPAALDALYGANPWGYTLFARLSIGR